MRLNTVVSEEWHNPQGVHINSHTTFVPSRAPKEHEFLGSGGEKTLLVARRRAANGHKGRISHPRTVHHFRLESAEGLRPGKRPTWNLRRKTGGVKTMQPGFGGSMWPLQKIDRPSYVSCASSMCHFLQAGDLAGVITKPMKSLQGQQKQIRIGGPVMGPALSSQAPCESGWG